MTDSTLPPEVARLRDLIERAKKVSAIDYCFGEADRQARDREVCAIVAALANLSASSAAQGEVAEDIGTQIAKAEFAKRWDDAAIRKDMADEAVTPEFLAWLRDQAPREGVAANVTWNAAVAWARSHPAPPASASAPRALIDANQLLIDLTAKWSGADKVEAFEVAKWIMERPLANPAHEGGEDGEQAPPHNLPDYDECALRVANSDFIAKRVAEGGYGPDDDSKLATQLHRFIYEYVDADPYRAAWFMHRLELLVNEIRSEALASRAQPAAASAAVREVRATANTVNAGSPWARELERLARAWVREAIKSEITKHPNYASDAEDEAEAAFLAALATALAPAAQPAAASAAVREALADALEFIEHYSHAWNGVSAKHPHGIVTALRAVLAAAPDVPPAEVAQVAPVDAGAREALAELVACKDLKESAASETSAHEAALTRARYQERKVKAWARARAVLATPPAEVADKQQFEQRGKTICELQDKLEAANTERRTLRAMISASGASEPAVVAQAAPVDALPETWSDRVEKELIELQSRLAALDTALQSRVTLAGIPENQQSLMHSQRAAMADYAYILQRRLRNTGESNAALPDLPRHDGVVHDDGYWTTNHAPGTTNRFGRFWLEDSVRDAIERAAQALVRATPRVEDGSLDDAAIVCERRDEFGHTHRGTASSLRALDAAIREMIYRTDVGESPSGYALVPLEAFNAVVSVINAEAPQPPRVEAKPTFEQWAAKRRMSAEALDEANLWIRIAYDEAISFGTQPEADGGAS